MAAEDKVNEGLVLYSPWQIYMASYFGSPVAGAWFISRNYRAMSQPAKVRESLILGVAAMFALLLIGFLLPDRNPNSAASPLFFNFAIYLYARHLFGPLYGNHIAAGGQRGSWWHILGISLLISFALIGVLLFVDALFPFLLEAGNA